MENDKTIFSRVVEEIKDNKQKREEGKHIKLPLPFPKLSKHVPGIQKGRYYLITGNQKSGKSKLADFIFIYSLINFIKENPEMDVEIKYFTLEMSKEDKIKEALAHFVYIKTGKILNPQKIDSLFDDYILDNNTLNTIEGFSEFFNFLESKVHYIDSISNPFGIYKTMLNTVKENGEIITKKGKKYNFDTKTLEDGEVFDYYRPYNENKYVICIVDNYNLLKIEKDYKTLYETISKFSSDYAITLRNNFKVIIVGIIQQAIAQESVDNVKLNLLRPSASGLGDNKSIVRDCDLMLGIFSPVRHDLPKWPLTKPNYDIRQFGNFYREISVILDRRGSSPAISCFFHGGISFFKELPDPDDKERMTKVENLLEKLNS